MNLPASTFILSLLFYFAERSFAQQPGAGKFGVFSQFNQIFGNGFGNSEFQPNLYGNYYNPQLPLSPAFSTWYAPYMQYGSRGMRHPAATKSNSPTLTTGVIDYYAVPWPNSPPLVTVADRFSPDPYWELQILKLNLLPQLAPLLLQQLPVSYTPALLIAANLPSTPSSLHHAGKTPASSLRPLPTSLSSALRPTVADNLENEPSTPPENEDALPSNKLSTIERKRAQQVVATFSTEPQYVIEPIKPTIIDPLSMEKQQVNAATESNEPQFVISPIKPTIVDPVTLPESEIDRTSQKTTNASALSAEKPAASIRPASDEYNLSTSPTNSADAVTNTAQPAACSSSALTDTTDDDDQIPHKPKSVTSESTTESADIPAVGTGNDESARKTISSSAKKQLPHSSTTTSSASKPTASKTTTARTDCKTDPSDSVCYYFSKAKANYIDAVQSCLKRDMVLAHANEKNYDFLNKLIDDALPAALTTKDKSSICTDRTTIVANWSPFMRYGSYAFLYGNAAGPACNFDADKQPFQSCAKDFDCTLVDWTQPAYFICAAEQNAQAEIAAKKLTGAPKKSVVQPTTQGELCMWSAYTSDKFEYLVSCARIRPPAESSSDAASGSKVIELPQFPARCMPIDYGDFFGESVEALVAARKKMNENKVSFWTSTIDPNVGQLKQCAPNCDDIDADKNSYVICRREVVVRKAKLPKFFQVWHDENGAHNVPYVLSNEFNATEKKTILSFVNKLANNSCLRFREASSDSLPPSFLHIVKDESPGTCRAAVVGFVPGQALMSLGEQCFGLPVSILRLLLQSVGIPAEQTRFDRDEHIKVNFENINPDPVYKLNYEKQPLPGLLQLNTPYDFFTVAHYPPRAYAKQKGLNVYETKVKVVKGRKVDIDNNRELSEGDKAKLEILYGKKC